jgi:hypothetical protein
MVVGTEQVLVQALSEGVKSVLMLNKVDRLFIDINDQMHKVVVISSNILRISESAFRRVRFALEAVSLDGAAPSIVSFTSFVRRMDLPKRSGKSVELVTHISKRIMRIYRASGVLPVLRRTPAMSTILSW